MISSLRHLTNWYRRQEPSEQVLLASAAFSSGLSAFRLLYSGTPVLLFLNWNLWLAFVPYYISRQLVRNVGWIEQSLLFRPLFVCWLLFLPNTFYITTDLFHLRLRPGVPLWFDLALLFSFAWNGLLLGLLSLQRMELVVAARWQLRRGSHFTVPALVLCGLGIYIGRYLRYNSWDVLLAPGELARDIAALFLHPVQARFDWSMIVLFSALLILIYESLRRLAAVMGR
ncbi:DUF1361 domain-containing protein [Flaviaesturariibacter flavus]|uniref:DUF1361 domain-containing protein n=1 Tax=Flaviaesturariibacter flavus TaxID=2502780 RepID=A0A4R1BBC4_9BACT|nr:DUF1361 domain-containing protein [Flaviaesturariibacter flavus]TCJ14301.1 DUF1361 domain-containing protein [Flaviaesturariibacter flavus]